MRALQVGLDVAALVISLIAVLINFSTMARLRRAKRAQDELQKKLNQLFAPGGHLGPR